MGVCKINIDTDLRLAMTASIREYLTQCCSKGGKHD
jgi:fructose-bisphosphate aldolase class II